MKIVIYKMICQFSNEDEMEFYSEESIEALIVYLESLTKTKRKSMAKQFKTETNKIHGLIVPNTDVHKKCNERISELEKENVELKKEIVLLKKENIELRKENAQLRKELDEFKFMFMEHLKVCKMQ